MDTLSGVKAVAFDAVGTLIDPDPPVAAVYSAAAARYGSRLPFEEIRRRFRAAFAAGEAADAAAGWATDEARERRRWQAIVTRVLDDMADPAACFAELWDHFARPASWRVLPGVEPVVRELAGRGLRLAIASNFDGRLNGVVAGLPGLAGIGPVVVSSAVGVRKPAGAFFDAVVRAVGCEPNEVLFIGDHPEIDVAGARAAGLRARVADAAGWAALLAELGVRQ